jgi:hypothetical protein
VLVSGVAGAASVTAGALVVVSLVTGVAVCGAGAAGAVVSGTG